MTKLIYAFADAMARPISFLILSFAAVLMSALGGVVDFGDGYWNVLNLTISILTMVIGQAVLVGSRRDGLATDLKLDRLIEAMPGDNDAIGSEHEHAEEIARMKQEVEERTGNGRQSEKLAGDDKGWTPQVHQSEQGSHQSGDC